MGGDSPVTPLFVALVSLLMANPSVPLSAALSKSQFPDKSNNPACLESRDYFLKCKRGTFALTVVAKIHLPSPLRRPAPSPMPGWCWSRADGWQERCHHQRKYCSANKEPSQLS